MSVSPPVQLQVFFEHTQATITPLSSSSSSRYLGLFGTDVVITEAGDQVQDLPPAAADIRAGLNCMK